MKFIKILTDMLPVSKIKSVDLNGIIGKENAIIVEVDNVADSFNYSGPALLVAYNAIVPNVAFSLGKDTIMVRDIEWVNLAGVSNGVTCVEIRVSTDAPNVIRQYVGDTASDAFDILTELAPQEEMSAN